MLPAPSIARRLPDHDGMQVRRWAHARTRAHVRQDSIAIVNSIAIINSALHPDSATQPVSSTALSPCPALHMNNSRATHCCTHSREDDAAKKLQQCLVRVNSRQHRPACDPGIKSRQTTAVPRISYSSPQLLKHREEEKRTTSIIEMALGRPPRPGCFKNDAVVVAVGCD